MNNLDPQYQDLLKTILMHGVEKSDRTGTGTLSIFGYTIRHNMKEGFPLLTTKKMAWKSLVTELIWFLRGDTNIKFLVDNNCNIWNGDAYKNYVNQLAKVHSKYYIPMEMPAFIDRIKTDEDFAKEFGELGPIYGKQWRDWNGVDQIKNLINDLKTNPDSRRLMVSAWNVEQMGSMVLPPCHYGFQVYTRELTIAERIQWVLKNTDVEMENVAITEEAFAPTTPQRAISLMWNQRSVDTFLGLPFNIASYGLLLEIIAKEVNMVPDQLIGNLGDTHLYLNHLEQAKAQIGKPYSLDERREMVTQEMFNEIYTGGDPSTLSHSEIDQWDVPRINERTPYTLPKLKIASEVKWKEGDCLPTYSVKDFTIENYVAHPTIKAPLSN